MSEEYWGPGPEYPKVTYEEAASYFSKMLSNPHCELCGNTQFAVGINNEDRIVPGLVHQSIDSFNISAVVPLVYLECTNCGNIKLFRERFIRAYISKGSSMYNVNKEGK